MKKGIAILLILLGFTILIYPLSTRMYSSYMQEKLMKEWETSSNVPEMSEEQSVIENYQELDEIFLTGGSNTVQAAEQTDTTSAKNSDFEKNSSVIGILQIDKIDLKIPVLEGASMENMDIGAGHISGTAGLGQNGNSAIAAHRSHSYGHMFNRLDELNAGDEIVVKDKGKTYKYKVYKKYVVEPTDVSVLDGDPSKRILTLVTCTPIYTATHRLIVHAELVEAA